MHLCLSSGITGVLNSANIARDILLEKYPERKIYIVDSFGSFLRLRTFDGFGLRICEMQAWGLRICITGQRKTSARCSIGFLYRFDVLHQGRQSNENSRLCRHNAEHLSAFACGLRREADSHAEGAHKRRRSLMPLKKKMEELAENGLAYDGKCYISHSACQADAEAVASLVESRFPNLNGRVLINSIGTTIGSHTGPGTVALFFWGEERKS